MHRAAYLVSTLAHLVGILLNALLLGLVVAKGMRLSFHSESTMALGGVL